MPPPLLVLDWVGLPAVAFLLLLLFKLSLVFLALFVALVDPRPV